MIKKRLPQQNLLILCIVALLSMPISSTSFSAEEAPGVLHRAGGALSHALNSFFGGFATESTVTNRTVDAAASMLTTVIDKAGPGATKQIESLLKDAVSTAGEAGTNTIGQLGAAAGDAGAQALREIGEAAGDAGAQALREIGEAAGPAGAQALREIGDAGVENMWKAGYAIVAVAAGYFLIKTGYNYGKNYLEKVYFTPKLEMEKGKVENWTPWIKRKLFGIKNKKIASELILRPETQQQLNEYKRVLKYASENRENLPSLLLYGPPGTGKTAALKELAKDLGFTFILLSGSSVSQYNEEDALKQLNDLFRWAKKKHSYPVLIFIDEAEQLLAHRAKMQSSKDKKILTHFLAETGTLNSNFTIVYTSNRPNEFDKAMERRITFQVEFGLPWFNERKKILKMYFDKFIQINPKIKHKIDLKTDLNKMSDTSQGLSGANLEEAMFRTKMNALSKGTVIHLEDILSILKSIQNKHATKLDYTDIQSTAGN